MEIEIERYDFDYDVKIHNVNNPLPIKAIFERNSLVRIVRI